MRLMKEIETILEDRNYSLNNIICETMKKFKIKTLCHKAGIQKADGFSATSLITLLLMFPIMALKSVHRLYESDYNKKVAMQKDTFYRLINNEKYSWRRFLYGVAKAFRSKANIEDKAKDGVSALIIDDTTDRRTGYKMENISYIHDHVLKKSVLGFKTLVLGFFDGKSFIPLDFSIHTEKKLNRRKAKKQYRKSVDPRTPGGKRRKETKLDKIKAAVQLVKRAVKNGFLADYLLCDSWFTCESLIKAVREIKEGVMHVVVGVKNGNQKYGYREGLFNPKEIVTLLKKEGAPSRCRSRKIFYYEAIVTYKGVGELKLFMCRYPGQKKWRIFATTDTKLSLIEMMRIYSIRWTIEIFFRECKQHLHFGKCQSRDFDAQIASITLTFTLYTLLAYLKRMESYETLGELFRLAQQDVCEKNMAERLWMLFEEMLAFLVEAIAAGGTADMRMIRQTEEYAYVKELFEGSFLFKQLESVDKAA